MAPPSDYAVPGGGAGRLKLKGIQDGRIEKKKKKKKAKANNPEQDQAKELLKPEDDEHSADERDARSRSRSAAAADQPADAGKTEAERRYEEARKKRLHERLKREGAKTHKERVEELNKYLSSLSEHHDMPRIGPG
ncbi:predicted protein [Uncinocarpus reesii 1704]|uniref:DUF1754-domain-containing protein n=1 Tax=Uncinocarpus reesii (strain UAMH 1704) TaxID=336963 RepID=C4JPQ5_UNCRE|nr:uncharacterized protein UREG_04548 [Uncinocarpus reesii 1704]EEP79702.1 predicted protein [Uncinocarpus reesii 1704]